METRRVVGCMTGTSLDGLDVALVQIAGSGLAMRAKFMRGLSRPLGELGPRLRRVAEQEPTTAGEMAALARDLALLHGRAVSELRGGDGIDLVAAHGQTVFHAPPVSWQMLNGAVLAEMVRAPVVFDLRAADMAAGGQGAPITPLADWVLFRDEREARAVVNLGGFCNVTLLPAGAREEATEGIRGMDVCACNHLLDGLARRLLGRDFDEGGAAALAGQVNEEALEDLGGVLASQAGARRSLGTGDEVIEWVSRFRARVSAGDLAATACEGLGQAIARALAAIDPPPDRVLLAGGGVHNAALVRAIGLGGGGWCSARVQLVDDHGVPSGFREAAEMAVLGALCADGAPITLPAVTGVRAGSVLSGVWARTK